MAANLDKFHVIFLGTEDNTITVNLGSTHIRCSNVLKLLGITIDNQLSFYPHVVEICKKCLSKNKGFNEDKELSDTKAGKSSF